jgi:hypothetical protein
VGRDGAGEAQGEGHSRLAGRQRGAGWASLMCVRQSDCLRVIEAVAGEESKRSQGVTASSWLTVDKEPHARSPCGEYPDPCPRGPPGGRFPSVAVWSIPWYPIVRYCGSFLNLYFCESSLLRINQRHHGLRTRLGYTPPAAVNKNRRRKAPATARSGGERGQGQSLWIDLWVPSAPPGPRALVLPPSSSFPPLSPPDPTLSIRPTGRWRGTHGLLGASSAGLLLGRPARRCAGGGLVVGRCQPLG